MTKLVYALVKLIKEAEEVELDEADIVAAEERLTTLAVYGERLLEASGGGKEACVIC